MGLLDDVDRRRERELQTRENSARLAHSSAVLTTTGLGTHHFEERVEFGVTFIEKPAVAYGSACDVDAVADALELEDADETPLPLAAGYVVAWDQDERDFYIGCWVSVKVGFPWDDLIDADVQPTIEHHFTFAAIALKDVPPDLTDATN